MSSAHTVVLTIIHHSIWQSSLLQALEADLADLKEQVVEARDTHPIWVAERTRLEAATADKAAALAATQSELAGVRAALADSKSLVAQLEFELSSELVAGAREQRGGGGECREGRGGGLSASHTCKSPNTG